MFLSSEIPAVTPTFGFESKATLSLHCHVFSSWPTMLHIICPVFLFPLNCYMQNSPSTQPSLQASPGNDGIIILWPFQTARSQHGVKKRRDSLINLNTTGHSTPSTWTPHVASLGLEVFAWGYKRQGTVKTKAGSIVSMEMNLGRFAQTAEGHACGATEALYCSSAWPSPVVHLLDKLHMCLMWKCIVTSLCSWSPLYTSPC